MEYGSFAKFFSIEIVRPRIPSDSDNGAQYYSDAQDRDYTNAYIYLPKDYSNTGKPSKVLLNFHGTTTFNLNQSALAEGQDLQRQFLAKCGYAVIDVCTDSYYTFVNYNYGTGASSGGYASNFPTPLAYECWSKVVEYCLDTYNLDPNEIYVIAKSSGGLNCVNFMNKFSGVKIKASALVAGSIDIFCNIRASYQGSINNFLMQIGCLNPDVHAQNIGVGPVNSDDKTYFEDNEAKIQAFNPILAKMSRNFDAHAFMEAVLAGIYSSTNPNAGDDSPLYDNAELSAMVGQCSVHNVVPVKIWHAVDDDNVPFTQSRWYVEMCKRGGSQAELRSWPAENGRHYFDSFVAHDDGTGTTYTPTLICYITPFGESVQANPVYAEIVDWFNRW
jgi:acetyl esterase/lipase